MPRMRHIGVMELFGSSGVRGIVGASMGPELVVTIAKAAGTVWDADRAVLGRDTRPSGQMLAAAAASGLASVGVDVVDVGVTPTPNVVRLAEAWAIPGLIITASHNPARFNGVKLVGAAGRELSVDALERVEACIDHDTARPADHATVGQITTRTGVNEAYIAAVRQAVDAEAIAAAELHVVIDPGDGAGSLTTPQLFRSLGCEVTTVNATTDGTFPARPPEPVPQHLTLLQETVRAADADLGIAHDGDADRAVFVDETGHPIAGEASLAALAAAELDAGATMVAAIDSSQRLVDVVEEAGARLELTPIGASHLITAIERLQAAGAAIPIAGEGNGGVFFPPYRVVRDGAYTAARFAALLAETSASAVVAPHQGYHTARANITVGDDRERARIQARADRYLRRRGGAITDIDGTRVDLDEGWILVRPSGTEPLVRIVAEAASAATATAYVEETEQAVVP